MNNKKKYSHEQYRDILSKAHKANSELNEYFCPECRRFVPKENGNDPCVFCGSTDWNLNNPLKQDIINYKRLGKYMYEIFRNCIEPFITFDKLEHKNGNFFYRKDTTKRFNKEVKSHYTREIEVWCVSNKYYGSIRFSVCVRYISGYNKRKSFENTCVRYFILEIPLEHLDYNDGKDDEFIFNLIYEQLLISNCRIYKIEYQAFNDKQKIYNVKEYIYNCCEELILHNGTLSIMQNGGYHLLQGGLESLITILEDFTQLPHDWI